MLSHFVSSLIVYFLNNVELSNKSGTEMGTDQQRERKETLQVCINR